ncbi:holin/antiholin [Caulobacter phage Seuss]|uniref:Holin/antiholin n=1 Tax=Caulobacter phage Seuss TaxID=1675601 RepID=A0A0K1LM82_9CAUD|nr:holin/antiholin [Caulobacter phage Seuss]AKU43569.1 holin/antiholin [Caulobacter phage Seuss]
MADKTPTATVAEPEVTASSPAGATVQQRTISHEEASDLPEPKRASQIWFFFVVVLACLGLTYWVTGRTHSEPTLREIARNALAIVALIVFVFGAGAGALDVVKLVGAIRTTRKETVTTAVGEEPKP